MWLLEATKAFATPQPASPIEALAADAAPTTVEMMLQHLATVKLKAAEDSHHLERQLRDAQAQLKLQNEGFTEALTLQMQQVRTIQLLYKVPL